MAKDYYFRGQKYASRSAVESAKKAYYDKQDAIRAKRDAERERQRIKREADAKIREARNRRIEMERKKRENARAVRQGFSTTASAFSNGGMRIFVFVFALITLYNLFGYFAGTNRVFTFSAFLEFLQGAPTIGTEWVKLFSLDIPNWGIFEPLAITFEKLVSFFQIIAFYGVSIINALLFILYFISWMVLGI